MKQNIPEAIIVAVSMAGGIARYLSEYVKTGTFQWKKFSSSVFVSAFAGWSFATFFRSIGVEGDLVNVLAGVGGFAGAEAIKYIWDRWTKNL